MAPIYICYLWMSRNKKNAPSDLRESKFLFRPKFQKENVDQHRAAFRNSIINNLA